MTHPAQPGRLGSTGRVLLRCTTALHVDDDDGGRSRCGRSRSWLFRSDITILYPRRGKMSWDDG